MLLSGQNIHSVGVYMYRYMKAQTKTKSSYFARYKIAFLEVIQLEYSLKIKIKRDDWLLVRKQPIIALYF